MRHTLVTIAVAGSTYPRRCGNWRLRRRTLARCSASPSSNARALGAIGRQYAVTELDDALDLCGPVAWTPEEPF